MAPWVGCRPYRAGWHRVTWNSCPILMMAQPRSRSQRSTRVPRVRLRPGRPQRAGTGRRSSKAQRQTPRREVGRVDDRCAGSGAERCTPPPKWAFWRVFARDLCWRQRAGADRPFLTPAGSYAVLRTTVCLQELAVGVGPAHLAGARHKPYGSRRGLFAIKVHGCQPCNARPRWTTRKQRRRWLSTVAEPGPGTSLPLLLRRRAGWKRPGRRQ